MKDGVIRSNKYFLREDYKYEMKKFEQVLSQFEEEDNDSFDDEDGYIEESYTLDDVLEILVADLDIYECIYKVPNISIENKEWEVFFDTIGAFYKERDLDGFFMDDMIVLNKYAIARSMVYEEESISLKTYISSLKYVESNILTINNIVEIAEKLGEKFGIDALSLIANEDGSYGCIGKNLTLFIIDNDSNDKTNEEVIKKQLEKNGYKVVDTVGIIGQEKPNNHNSNVVSIDSAKRKSKVISIYDKK